MRILITLLIFPFSLIVYGQNSNSIPMFDKFQEIKASKSYTSGTQSYSTRSNNSPVALMNNQTKMTVQQRNRIAMQKMQPQSSYAPSQAEIRADLERKRYAQYQQQLSHQQQQLKIIYSIINENKKTSYTKKDYSYAEYGKYRFANHNSTLYKKHIPYYEKATLEMIKMLKGERKLSVKDAIYYSENAFLGGQLPYEEYNKMIEHYKYVMGLIAKQHHLDLSNSVGVQFTLQKLYNDTIYDPKTKQYFYPLTYDFEDIYGDENYTQLFVSKLLSTGGGQCHSMPLLGKILSDEYNGNSYLAYSPSHSYLQFKNEKGRFVNFETTNGSLTNNNFIVGSGFVKAEAIKSKIYLKGIDTKKIIAQLLSELATMYRKQLGYDDFIDKCTSTTLEYYPKSITAYMEKSNLETAKLDEVLFNINYPNYEELKEHEKELKQLNWVASLYDHLDKLGYSKMPKDAYDQWLKSLEEEKQKRENQKLRIQFNFNKYD